MTHSGFDTGFDTDAAVDVRGLMKSYGDVHAVAGVDLRIETGEIFALLGPNGAGKTTTVEILEGYRRQDGGEVRVLGLDPARDAARGTEPASGAQARRAGLLAAVRRRHEQNPMLGLRGVRLGLVVPGIYAMQVRALAEAMVARRREGGTPVACLEAGRAAVLAARRSREAVAPASPQPPAHESAWVGPTRWPGWSLDA